MKQTQRLLRRRLRVREGVQVLTEELVRLLGHARGHRMIDPGGVNELIEGRQVPIDRAGCYVPGGRAIYPSTVLMTAVPAKVARVPEVVLCVPPDPRILAS